MNDQDVGGRLKKLRAARGLSLRALAKKTGTAASFLSALEGAKSSVSVATLKRVLDALGTTLGEFFSDEQPAPRKVAYRKRELVEISGQRNGISFRDVAAGRPGRLLQLLVERHSPGSDTGPELYVHEGEEAGVVLKGKLELTVEGEAHLLGQGDAYYFQSDRPHRMRNPGRTTVHVVSVCSPPSF
jgi:transcriptional regulator with XRE-family HTH domain